MAIRRIKKDFKENYETWSKDIGNIISSIEALELPTEENVEYEVKDRLQELLYTVEDVISDYQNATSMYESKKLSEGTKFNATKFKKNCLIAEKAIDEIIDDNYDNVDDLTDNEATFIKNHFGSIITRCRKFLDDFGLTESRKTNKSKKLKESKLREFTKSDWNAFAGAEEFDDGSQPLIAEFADGIITLIVSGTGDVDDDNEAIVQLIYLDDDEESEGGDGAWYKDFESKKDAIKFALEASTELDYYTAEYVEYDDVENFAYSNKMSSFM